MESGEAEEEGVDVIPILGFDDTVIAYLDDVRNPMALAWYRDKHGETKTYTVQVSSAQRVDTAAGKERAMLRLLDRIRVAEEKIPQLEKTVERIDASIEFLNQELESKGPDLPTPLSVLNDFVGYQEGGKLVRITSSRYNIAKGSDSSGEFEFIGRGSPIQFSKRTMRVEDSLRTNRAVAEKKLEELRRFLELWRKNLEIIEKDAFEAPQ